MDFKTLMSTLFGFSAPTFYSWKKEQRPIISLIEKYFTKGNLEEFIETGKINKMENINITMTVSLMNFSNKVATMYTEQGEPDLFYNFIVYYTKLPQAYNDWHDNYIWQGFDEISEFQEEFYQYLINCDTSMSKLRNMSNFINQLNRADLLFLNMNILNGFIQLSNNRHDKDNFYSYYTKSSILDEILLGLKTAYLNTMEATPSNKSLENLIRISINDTVLKYN